MNLRINLHLFCTHHLLAELIFKYLITQKVFILVSDARPSAESVVGLGPRLAPNRTFRFARRYFCRGFFGRLGLHDIIFFQCFSLRDVIFVADFLTFRFAWRYFLSNISVCTTLFLSRIFWRLGLHVIFFGRFSLHDVIFVLDILTFRFARRYFFPTFQFARYTSRFARYFFRTFQFARRYFCPGLSDV